MTKVPENKHISVIDLPNVIFDILNASENTPSMICIDQELKEEAATAPEMPVRFVSGLQRAKDRWRN